MCGYDCDCIIDKKATGFRLDKNIQEYLYTLRYNPNSDSDKEALLINYNYKEFISQFDATDSEKASIDDSVLFLLDEYDVYHRTGDCQMEALEKHWDSQLETIQD